MNPPAVGAPDVLRLLLRLMRPRSRVLALILIRVLAELRVRIVAVSLPGQGIPAVDLLRSVVLGRRLAVQHLLHRDGRPLQHLGPDLVPHVGSELVQAQRRPGCQSQQDQDALAAAASSPAAPRVRGVVRRLPLPLFLLLPALPVTGEQPVLLLVILLLLVLVITQSVEFGLGGPPVRSLPRAWRRILIGVLRLSPRLVSETCVAAERAPAPLLAAVGADVGDADAAALASAAGVGEAVLAESTPSAGGRGDGPVRGLPDDTGRLGRPPRRIGDHFGPLLRAGHQ
mmetsp:Transcript_17772/g.53491  ORF Transcript_17772/g.53491 Transcript_17772/m.53491 type:complete len:285 (+) Transcript_17772:150-1004(+)